MIRFKIGAVLAAALAMGGGAALANDAWPSKPVRFVVSFPPGSPGDQILRVIQPNLQQGLGQPVVIENRPGAGGNLGMQEVVRASDGHTALVGPDTMLTLNPHLYKKLPYKPLDDLMPVTLLATTSQMLVCNPNVAAKTLADLVDMSRKSDMSYASGGPGVPGHMAMELLLATTKARMSHVPYRGPGPAMLDVIGGSVPCGFLASSTVGQNVKDGKLKAIVVSGARRLGSFPQVPTAGESGATGYAANFGEIVAMPKGTPAPNLQRLRDEIAKALALPDVKGKLTALDLEIVASTPDEARSRIRVESSKWGDVATRVGLQLD